MKLQTCKQGLHVNRAELRQHTDLHGNHHVTEWHVCRFCARERKHRTVRVRSDFESIRSRI